MTREQEQRIAREHAGMRIGLDADTARRLALHEPVTPADVAAAGAWTADDAQEPRDSLRWLLCIEAYLMGVDDEHSNRARRLGYGSRLAVCTAAYQAGRARARTS